MVLWNETVSGWNAAENGAEATTNVANAQFASRKYSFVHDGLYLGERLYVETRVIPTASYISLHKYYTERDIENLFI